LELAPLHSKHTTYSIISALDLLLLIQFNKFIIIDTS